MDECDAEGDEEEGRRHFFFVDDDDGNDDGENDHRQNRVGSHYSKGVR